MFMIMLARFSERIFNLMRYTGLLFWESCYVIKLNIYICIYIYIYTYDYMYTRMQMQIATLSSPPRLPSRSLRASAVLYLIYIYVHISIYHLQQKSERSLHYSRTCILLLWTLLYYYHYYTPVALSRWIDQGG